MAFVFAITRWRDVQENVSLSINAVSAILDNMGRKTVRKLNRMMH